jgi:asparagine synthase (glutamine-hydrolysing)
MCGILGFSFQAVDNSNDINTFSEFSLRDATQSLSHRGPDDGGIFLNLLAGIGLGHRRLSILDTSIHGHQPMSSIDNSVVIIFNGEIYNFKDLRIELELKGFIFRGHSDTEVLLNLYLAEGRNMLNRLNGIFAFAILDSRTNILFIARDAFGVKPLYYYSLDRNFVFSSEIKSLLLLAPKFQEIEAISLHRYLKFLWCPGQGTPLKNVYKLEPGQALEVRYGEIINKWDWFDLPVLTAPRLIHDKNEILDGIATHLRNAVARQMVSDFPLGAFLSGGLDSSAVVAFARDIDPDIRCFTISTSSSEKSDGLSDLPYAIKMSQHLGVDLEVIKVTSESMASNLQRMVIQMDEPIADPAALNVFFISEAARAQGIKVLLSGVGGDDLFTGYRRHLAIQAEGFIDLIPQGIRDFLSIQSSKLDQRNLFSRRLSKVLRGIDLNGDERLINYFGWAMEPNLFELYTPEFKLLVSDEMANEPFIKFLSRMPENTAPLDKMLGLEQRFFLSDHNLIYTDKMAMAAGVEVRVPFLDKDLVEFAAKIPLQFKQRFNTGKWILKKAMEPYLPRDLIYRPKTGFTVPLRHWMKFELNDLMRDLLSTASLRSRGFFEVLKVQELIKNNESGRADASYTLLSLMCIEIWCREFLD